MRNMLVDHARGRGRVKRGGDRQRVSLSDAIHGGAAAGNRELSLTEILSIDDALGKLAALDERKASLVELRFFAGLSGDDAARILGISRSTAADEWRMARAWLYRELKDGAP
jgi:RNA polymerase sigma factor (TIGR02999 family)